MENGSAHYTAEVKPEWIDENNHMTFWAYVKLFDESSASFLAKAGIAASSGSEPREFRTSQHHVKFSKESFAGDPLEIEVQILGYGQKHIHIFQRMRNRNDGQLLAVEESVKTNLDGSIRLPFAERERAFQPNVLERISLLAKEHERLPWPVEAGAAIKSPLP
jgi:acyl-CoA thioesterase FadM